MTASDKLLIAAVAVGRSQGKPSSVGKNYTMQISRFKKLPLQQHMHIPQLLHFICFMHGKSINYSPYCCSRALSRNHNHIWEIQGVSTLHTFYKKLFFKIPVKGETDVPQWQKLLSTPFLPLIHFKVYNGIVCMWVPSESWLNLCAKEEATAWCSRCRKITLPPRKVFRCQIAALDLFFANPWIISVPPPAQPSHLSVMNYSFASP